MEAKRPRGRQPIPKTEKKIAVTIWVKSKHVLKAKKDCQKIKEKYDIAP